MYWVEFTATDFTVEEVKKMQSFGVPQIDILFGPNPNQRQPVKVQLTQLSPSYKVNFPNELDAKGYVDRVVTQVRAAMETLRSHKDDYTATDEVTL